MDQQHQGGSQALVEAWMKTATEFLGSTAKMWAEAYRHSNGEAPWARLTDTRPWESLGATLKTWQTLSAVMAQPGAMESMVKGVGTLPEIFSRVLTPAWEGFFHLQHEWMERVGRIGTSKAGFQFEAMDQEAFKIWNELYEKEFRQFLQMPQIGLLRVYQEHINAALDKFQVFQTNMAEFISLLYMPAEKSLEIMQEKLSEMASDGHLPEKTKEYYNMWVQILESRYMILFKSPEYNRVIAATVEAMAEFLTAKRQLLEDSLRSLPMYSDRSEETCREVIDDSVENSSRSHLVKPGGGRGKGSGACQESIRRAASAYEHRHSKYAL